MVKLSNLKIISFSPLLSTKCVYKSIGSGREPTSFMTGKSVENTDEEGRLVSTRPVLVILESILPDPPVIPLEVSIRKVVNPPPCVPSLPKNVPLPTEVPISPTTEVLELVPKSVPNPSRPKSLPAGLPGDVILRIVVFFVIVLDPPVPDPASDESAKPVPEDVLVTVLVFVLSNELLLLLLDSETLDNPSLATPPPLTVIEPLKLPSTLNIKYYNRMSIEFYEIPISFSLKKVNVYSRRLHYFLSLLLMIRTFDQLY